ncbi:GNVR domain-containing protein [bacterium]
MNQFNPISVIFRNKFQVLAAGLICAFAAALVSLGMPNKYQASSKLVVMPLAFKTDLNRAPLGMLVYRELAKNDSISAKLAEEFTSEEKELNLEKMKESMEVILVQKKGAWRQEEYVQVMELVVKMPSPVLARDVANRWSELFVEAGQILIQSDSDKTLKYINDQFNTNKEELETMEREMAALKVERAPETLNAEIDSRKKNYNDILARMLQTELRLGSNRILLQRRNAELSQMKTGDGRWLGEETDADIPKNSADYLTRETIQSKQLLMQVNDRLNDHVRDTHIYRVTEEYEAKLNRLRTLETLLIEVSVEVAALESRTTSLGESLEGQEPATTLKRGMNTDTIFETLANKYYDALTDLSKIRIDTEVLNPVYGRLEEERQTSLAQLSAASTRMEEIEKRIGELKTEVDSLKDSLLENNEAMNLLQGQREVYENIYKSYSDMYIKLHSDVNALKKNVLEDEQLLKKLEQQEVVTEKEINTLIQALLEYNIETARMERRSASARATYKLLAEKLTEAELEKAQNAPLVRIAVPAVAPTDKVAPKRMVLTLFGAILGVVAATALVLLREVVKNES